MSTVRGDRPDAARVPWRAVVVFLALAIGLGWAVAAPMWIVPGIREPSASTDIGTGHVIAFVTPFAFSLTAAVSAIAVALAVHRPARPAAFLGLRGGRAGRTALLCLIGVVTPPLCVLGGTVLAAALGLVRLDASGAGFRAFLLDQATRAGIGPDLAARIAEVPTGTMIGVSIGIAATIGIVTTSLAALAELLGWHGWLLAALRPLGTWPAIAITGLAWGLWRAPLVLLGDTFEQPGPLGLVLALGLCLVVGAFLSWLRLRGATLYPAALAFGSLSICAVLIPVVLAADPVELDRRVVMLGWTTWVPFLAIVGVLAVTGAFRRLPREDIMDAAATAR